jgi:hypothetical protein
MKCEGKQQPEKHFCGRINVMTYIKHLLSNWGVAGRSLTMALFHFIHGILPFKCTEHERHGLKGPGKEE